MSYTDEYQTALRQIDADNPGIQSLHFFISTVEQWHRCFDENQNDGIVLGRQTPLVVVLGHGIPETLLYASGVAPFHLLGGSHASCQWSDDVVPRDSDPVSRSIFGYALRLAERSDLNPLYVVPMTNDNMRKIAYLLKREGHEVLTVDIPPVKTSMPSQIAWERSASSVVQAIQRHTGRRATARNIRKADQLVGAAKAAIVNFEQICTECDGVLSNEARLLVLNSFFQTADLAQWTTMLRMLSAEIRERYCFMGRPTNQAPRILVIGSSILFPQYKVLSLIHDAGLRLSTTVDAASTSCLASLAKNERHGGTERLIRTIARKSYSLDASSAHVINHAMEQYVEFLLSSTEIDGVVCHILKGQIEHDFTLSRMEPLFERLDVPVFRLETDYQYQDVEQLRIRLEAFAEMLGQRRFAAGQLDARLRCA